MYNFIIKNYEFEKIVFIRLFYFVVRQLMKINKNLTKSEYI